MCLFEPSCLSMWSLRVALSITTALHISQVKLTTSLRRCRCRSAFVAKYFWQPHPQRCSFCALCLLHLQIYRRSYMSAHVLLNLLNELGKRDKMRGLPSILSLFRNEFNKFNNTRARKLDSIYHMTNTLKSLFWRKNVIILSLCTQRYYGLHNVSRKSINH